MKSKPFIVYFPKSFIITMDSLLENVYDNIATREDYLHFFYLIDVFKNNDEKREWASFSQSYLRNEFGRKSINGKYYWVLTHLIDYCKIYNLIKIQEYSTSSKQTRKYAYSSKFTEDVLNTELGFIGETFSDKTIKQILKYAVIPTDKNLLAQYTVIKERLEIDEISASMWALNEFKYHHISDNQYKNIRRNIGDLMSKNTVFVSEDPKTGRVSSSFNTIKRELRSYCTIDGVPLKSLDLKSSQPYLLASYLLSKYSQNKEVQLFYDLITKDDIYEYLLKKWGLYQSEYMNDFDSRQFAKLEMFKYLYKDVKGDCTALQIIKSDFPLVHQLIIKEKKQTGNLAVYLQKLEADIFIPVCNKFVNEGCLSVHDSLYFKENLEREVRQELSNQLNKLGYTNYILK